MDRGQETLVGGPQQRHAWGLVDAARFGLDDAVLDLVAHAHAVAAADGVGLQHQGDGAVETMTVDRHRLALLETDRDVLGRDLDCRVPELDAHDRFHRLQGDVEVLEGLGLVGGSPDVGVGGVGLLLGVAVGQAAFGQPGAHFGATAQQ